jgi:hypothetical protein
MASPHKVICSIYRVDDYGVGWRDERLTGYFFDGFSHEFYFGESPMSVDNILKIKPYLRPMSSMTDEEKRQYRELCDEDIRQLTYVQTVHPGLKYKTSCHRSIDWLNAHHFDYRGLIEKGLALEAPEGMYK